MNKLNTESLVEGHSNLIYKIAYKYKEFMPIEDLYQIGVIGLIKASNNYDPTHNTKFSTYAFDYIRGEMLYYIRKENPIKVSKDYFKIRKLYENAKELMTNNLNREVSISEVSLYLGIDEGLINDVISSTDYLLSLDNLENESLYDFVGLDNWDTVDNNLLLSDMLSSLNEEERKIIECRYLMDLTQDETGKMLGMSQIGISRREKKTILKLQKENVFM